MRIHRRPIHQRGAIHQRGGVGAELPAVQRTVSCCLVCGSREVRTDEVAQRQRGWLLLAECRHCDHRWTQRLPGAPAPLSAPASVRGGAEEAGGLAAEVASAA